MVKSMTYKKRKSLPASHGRIAKMAFNQATKYIPGGNYIRAAGAAYRMGKRAVAAYKTFKPKSKKFKGSSKWNNTSTGVYAGRFKKTTKVKHTIESIAQTKGYHAKIETFGKIEDPNALYIVHSTFQVDLMSRAICGALLRKLMTKAGLQLSNRTHELPLFSTTNSDGFKVTYEILNPVTLVATVYEYIIVDNQNFTNVLESFFDFRNHIALYLNNADQSVPARLIFYSSDRNGLDTNWRLASSLNLNNEYMVMTVYSNIKIQNRTAGDTAGAGDKTVDRVDNQPLKGRIYDFKHANPRLKYQTGNPLEFQRIDAAGINLVKTSSISEISWQNAPPEKMFQNCIKSANLLLQPGNIKNTSIAHTHKGKLTSVMMKIRAAFIETNRTSGALGRSQMIMLEEKLRTIGTNPVTVQYERDYKVGCYFTTTKQVAILSNFQVSELNLV